MDLADKRVGVLMGGVAAERDVSLSTGRGCVAALGERGLKVEALEVGADVAEVLQVRMPDIVLNALHGGWGENGTVQGVLELLRIPYTHSGVLASALAMDKTRAKAVLAAAGVHVAPSRLVDRHEAAARHILPPPYVAKPNAQGSSFGVIRVFEGANAPPVELADPSWPYGDDIVVEPYIAGKELAVTVMHEADGPRALSVTEITPLRAFFDYDAKYTPGASEHTLPANIPPEFYALALDQAKLAHQALGCRGVTRSDFRFDPDTGTMILLEVNTQPGMTPTSLVPEQAALLGMSFADLLIWMLNDASCDR